MRRNVICIISLLTLLCGCGSAKNLEPDSTPDQEVDNTREKVNYRLVSYNVGNFGKYVDLATGMEYASEVIQKMDADFVGMQELDSCTTRNGDIYLLGHLCKEDNLLKGEYDCHFSPAFDFLGGKYGSGIIWKSNQNVTARHSLKLNQYDGYEVRSLSVVETEELVFSTIHLDHKSADAALQQLKDANAFMHENFSTDERPVFITGDFNCTPSSDIIKYLEEDWDILSDTKEYTFSPVNPSKCIDYVAAMKKDNAFYEVTRKGVYTIGKASKASDHYPAWVKVNIYKKK